jgi:hypothetical protein
MSDLRHLQAAADDAARFVQATWQQVVMGAMSVPGVDELQVNVGLRRAYAESIVLAERLNIPQAGQLRRKIIATHNAAMDLEQGKGAWDMKPGLLNGPKARVTKKGKKFNIIPFRHRTTSGATGNQHFSGVMPKDIHQAAKMLKQGQRLTGTERKYPALNKVFTKPDGTIGRYHHKSGIYEGMKKSGGKGQGSYQTFRIVSEDSDPNSWWHPGFSAHHVARGVGDFCRPTIENRLRQAAEKDLVDLPSLSIGMNITLGS